MVVVVWVSDPSERLHPGMQGLDVQIAYVVDQTLGRDTAFDATKVDVIGRALVDDISPSTNPPEQHTKQPLPGARWSLDGTDGGAPSVMNEESFHHQLNRMIAALATLTGLHPGSDIPEQTWGEIDEPPGRSIYQIGPNSLRYYRFDPTDGWQWVTARDLDDLLFRVVDDTARMLAWRWSERAPMAAAGRPRREAIARGFWRTLMAALDADQVDRLPRSNSSHNLPGRADLT